MDFQLDSAGSADLSRRRKAAMVVQMMISEGGSLSLAELPERLQETLTSELGAIRLVDRNTVTAVAEEFVAELESVGLAAPGSRDGAILALSDHLSPGLAERLRMQMDSVKNGDHWPMIIEFPVERLVSIMMAESIEVCAVALSKLPVAKAAAVLGQTPGDRARRITYAMSQTSGTTPDAVRRIGAAIALDYGRPDAVAFEKAPVQRLGAILNSTITDKREDVLVGLDDKDPEFANDVRKAIFTFKDIPPRIRPTDIPNCIRAVDNDVLVTALSVSLAGDEALVEAAEFILKSMSQRMAGQLRDDVNDRGRVRRADGEAAMAEVTAAIREMVDAGSIKLIDPDEDEDD